MEAITHLQPYSEHDYNKVARERLKTHPLEEQSLRGFQSVLNAIQQKSHNRYCYTCNNNKKSKPWTTSGLSVFPLQAIIV